MAVTTSLTFNAAWHQGISDYRPLEETCCKYMMRLAYNVISVVIPIIGLIRIFGYLLNNYMRNTVLPSSLLSEADIQRTIRQFDLRWNSPAYATTFQRTPLRMTTPDGVELAGTFIRHRGATADTPTVVLFQPNACISKYDLWWKWMAEYCIHRGRACNFVLFDYRGTGASGGRPECINDLILDGDTVMQFVENSLGIRRDKTIVYGWSLGGGISAKTLSLRNFEGRYINERSFRDTESVIHSNVIRGLAHFYAFMGRRFGWELNSLEACERIRARKLIIHHREDEVIPPSAGMADALQSRGAQNVDYIELHTPLWYGAHYAPLDVCLDARTGAPPTDDVMNFIIGLNIFRSAASLPISASA